MCSIDIDESCDVWIEKKVRARKPHFCATCGGEGDVSSEKMCLLCEAARTEFFSAHGSTEANPSFFRKLLGECIHDGDEESDQKWKPMLVAMDARRQMAIGGA